MPTDPLTPQQLAALAPTKRFPKQRFLASPFERDGEFAYYDLQTYLNKMNITGSPIGGPGGLLDGGDMLASGALLDGGPLI